MHLLPGRMSRMCRRRPLLPRRCRRRTAAATAGTGNALPTRTLPGKPVNHFQGRLTVFLTESGKPLACEALAAAVNKRHHLTESADLLGLSWRSWRRQESFL